MRVILIILALFLVFPATAYGASGACNVKKAKKERAAALKRYKEADKIYKNTVKYTKLYGNNTGRWVKLSRKVGWQWGKMPTLMKVIFGESRGNHKIVNSLGCVGLTQIHPCHGKSRAWLQNARNNLNFARKLAKNGWGPWAETAY